MAEFGGFQNEYQEPYFDRNKILGVGIANLLAQELPNLKIFSICKFYFRKNPTISKIKACKSSPQPSICLDFNNFTSVNIVWTQIITK